MSISQFEFESMRHLVDNLLSSSNILNNLRIIVSADVLNFDKYSYLKNLESVNILAFLYKCMHAYSMQYRILYACMRH